MGIILTPGETRFDVEIESRADWVNDGCDTIILRMSTGQVVVLNDLVMLARVRSEEAAARLGVRFRRGSFVLTSDPDTVLRWGVMPEHAECDECRDAAAGAAMILESDDSVAMLVGQLEWGRPT